MNHDLRNELLDNGLSDILQLSWVMSVTSRHAGKQPDDPSIVTPTLEIICDLLESGYVIAGDVTKRDDGILYVRSWGLSPADAVERIAREWYELPEPPKPGEIVWLELTDAGRAKIHSISDLEEDERELLQQVMTRRRPELRERVSVIGQGKLNWVERQAIHDALAEELAATEQGGHGGHSDYARKINDLLDRALVF